MVYIVYEQSKYNMTLHSGDTIPVSLAKEVFFLQADGDELTSILSQIPSLDNGKRVQTYYGSDAQKAAMVFCDI